MVPSASGRSGLIGASSAKRGARSAERAAVSRGGAAAAVGIERRAKANPSAKYAVSPRTNESACSSSAPRSHGGRLPHTPKSTKAIELLRSQTIMLPACRSAWKRPPAPATPESSSTESACTARARARAVFQAAPAPCGMSGASLASAASSAASDVASPVAGVLWLLSLRLLSLRLLSLRLLSSISESTSPSIRSAVSTAIEQAASTGSGTVTAPSSPARRTAAEERSHERYRSIFARSIVRSHSARMGTRTSSTIAAAELESSSAMRGAISTSATRASSQSTPKSTVRRSRTPGRTTLTTTRRPSRSVPPCTCAMLADASGARSRLWNTSSTLSICSWSQIRDSTSS
mmetsp:Transcript_32729/g.97706  ORF Transcript_32729/g.97706 Transcript_32729/m.97706 type:complete len:348 (+) Transcript_32729:732-1775(+)